MPYRYRSSGGSGISHYQADFEIIYIYRSEGVISQDFERRLT